MATAPAAVSYETLAKAPDTYFKAVDAMDIDGRARALRRRRDAHRADRPRHVHGRRRDPPHVHGLLRRVGHDRPRDPQHRRRARRLKVATEQGYFGELKDGSKNDMHNCNFFTFNEDGKFSRVIIWMAGTNPLQ